ncbi:YbfB/YjiJ family MFS transporter [Embleya sp. NPDC050154]|uniref:YbfB/YjiJ family MFS transporter n=1 Tax=Embleya sp. NPDC050154 TaxID=3363988 RepID=UPI00378CFB27
MIATSLRLALGTAVALGFARFGYGLVLPAMRADLGWSLGKAGLPTTANGVGYLGGAGVAAALARRCGTTCTFRAGMIVCAVSLALTAADVGFAGMAAARVSAGFAGALVFITGGVIASRTAERTGSSLPITVYFAGAGLGIALSGALLPPLLAGSPARWPVAWIALAAASALATAVGWGAARSADSPAERGDARSGCPIAGLGRPAVAYLLFAAGYIAYITFLSAALEERHTGTGQVASIWVVLGSAVVIAPWVWRRAFNTWPPERTLAVLLAVLAASACLALIRPPEPAGLAVLVLSAAMYGLTFMAVPASVTALIRTNVPPPHWSRTLGAFTAVFAIGQTVGPWAAGAVADRTAADAALVWTAALCALGALATTLPRSRVGPRTAVGADGRRDLR